MFAFDKENWAETEFYIVDLIRVSNITNGHDLLNMDGSIYHFVQILDVDVALLELRSG